MVELTEELRLALEADDRERLDTIVERGDAEDYETLRELVRDDATDETYRRRALYALGEWSGREKETLRTIEAVFPDLGELERITAVDALGRIGTPAARDRVIDLADADSPDVRRGVVNALARIGDDEARRGLSRVAERDDAEHVRELAQRQVRRLDERSE